MTLTVNENGLPWLYAYSSPDFDIVRLYDALVTRVLRFHRCLGAY